MTLLVKKFGGTSVGSLERIQAVAHQIAAHYQQGQSLIVVVSAMSGETDRLFRLAHQLTAKPAARELASLITLGEQTSMNLLAFCLQTLQIPSISLTGAQAGIRTNQHYLAARIDHIEPQAIQTALSQRKVVIVAGFQGINATGETTALGRGGSDTSAVALAAVFKAAECQIYTDVDGIYTADPRLVAKAYRLDQIALPLMLELASLGAKVLQLRSVELAGKYHVPLRVLSSFHEGAGTLIDYTKNELEAPVVAGLAHKTSLWQFQLTLRQASLLPYLLTSLIEQGIQIEHFQHQHHANTGPQLTLYIAQEMADPLADYCQTAVAEQQLFAWQSQTGFARLALVGQGVRSQISILQTFFASLQQANILWHDFFSSECALSLILAEEDLAKTAQTLHHSFFERC